MSQLLCLVHLLDHLTCVCFESKELITQAVNESRKRPGISDCFLFGNVQIVVIAVNSLVTRKATSIRQFFHARAKSKTFNFLEEIVSGTSSFNNQFFQASAKECACSSWRKVCNALGFLEDIGNRFRHAFGRLNGCSIRINHFALFPKCDFPAVSADLYEVLVWIKKLKEISWNDVGFPIGNHSYQINTFRPLVQLRNQLILELAVIATVWAGECF